MKIPTIKRHTGIDVVGNMPWGTHFCQFYKTQKDLVEVLVPYFREGLDNNEFCMCITSEPFDAIEAYTAFKKAIPGFDQYIEKGQIEILPYTDWYTPDGDFEEKKVLSAWVSKLRGALSKGFEGLRFCGNTYWLEKKDWNAFAAYEETINKVIGQYRMLGLSTYCLEKMGASQIIDVVANHEFAIIKREGDWILIENIKHKETKTALVQSEERLRSNSQDVIYRLNVQTGRYEYLSPSVQTLFGYSVEEIQEQNTDTALSLVHPDIAEQKVAQALLENSGKAETEFRQQTKNGDYRWFSNRMSLIRDEAGRPLYRDGNIRDITEHKMAEKALEDSQEKLKLALSTSNVGIWNWNLKTDEIFWDKGIIKMHLKNDNSPIKTFKDFEALINEDDLLHVQRAIKGALNKGVPFNTIFRLKSSGDDPSYINIKALVYKDENGIPSRMIGVCIDITELTRSTKKTLVKLNEELTRSNKDLQSFSYIASHDLQEPLRMVSSFTQLLALKYKDQLDQTAQEYIQFAVEGANRMYELINGLLDYSRIDTKGKCFKIVDMQKISELVKQNLSLVIAEKNASFTWDELPTVFADESQVSQLLQNLVSNALKFCSENPKIHLSSRFENERYVFSIKDNGIGIQPEYFERIFQIYQRLHTRDEYRGTGLGLAICKRIVERHKGKIWLTSELGQGTTFYFSLQEANDSLE